MESLESMLGQCLNERFHLLEVIGVGGMSVVYKAIDLRQQELDESDPFVAVKILRPALRADPRFWALLGQEAKKSQVLSHPNIVNVFDYDRSENLMFMTMELLPEVHLAEHLRRQSLPDDIQTKIQLVIQMLDAVIYAHQQGVIHGDLKPSNIAIQFSKKRHQPKVKIFDFGIARALQKTNLEISACSPAYATPATVAGAAISPYDDAYGIACVIYELLAGQHPFRHRPSTALASDEQPDMIESLSVAQWQALKEVLSAARYRHSAAHQDNTDLESAQVEVLAWLEHLRGAFGPQSHRTGQRVLAVVVVLGLCVWASLSWNQGAHDRRERRMTAFLEAAQWDQALALLQEIQVRDSMASLSAKTQKLIWDQLPQELERLLTLNNESYDPKAGFDRITQLLALFPDSNRINDLARYYASRVENNRQTILTRFHEFLSSPAFCTSAKVCRLWMNTVEIIHQHHQELLDHVKPNLLRAYLQAYGITIYRQEWDVAQVILKQARLVFPSEQALEDFNVHDGIPSHRPSSLRNIRSDESLPQVSFDGFKTLLDPETVSASVSDRDRQAHAYFRVLRGTNQEERSSSKPAYSTPMIPDPCAVGGQAVGFCRDQFKNGAGPALVSVWMDAGYRLAVSRYELSWGDFSSFCAQQGCATLQPKHPTHPVQHLAKPELERYLQWLSRASGFQYRLLTLEEWQSLADPMGLLSDLIVHDQEHISLNCNSFSLAYPEQIFSNRSVFQGSSNRYGIFNLADLSAEIVSEKGAWVIVPGRVQRLQRCQISERPQKYPFAAFRVARLVHKPNNS